MAATQKTQTTTQPQTVRDLFQMDCEKPPLSDTQKQIMIVTVAQRNMDKPVSEFAEPMNASENYVRDVLKRAML